MYAVLASYENGKMHQKAVSALICDLKRHRTFHYLIGIVILWFGLGSIHAQPVAIENVLTLGSAVDPSFYVLDAQVDSARNIYEADGQAFQVSKYDQNGSLVAQVGRHGPGPRLVLR